MHYIEIDIARNIKAFRIAIEDERLANKLSILFNVKVREHLNLEETDHVIVGRAESGYSFDNGVTCLPESNVLGNLDAALDKRIRATATPTSCTLHSCGVAASDGKAAALLGTSHAGKTTLGMACAMNNLALIDDEFGFLDLLDGTYSHVHYPLCVREQTWNLMGTAPPASSLRFETPYGNVADMVAPCSVNGLALWEKGSLSLRVVIVPHRAAGVTPILRRLSVAEWPKVLMTSIDAPISRDELFRRIVHIFGKQNIAVFEACYDNIWDGTKLVEHALSHC